MGIGLAQAASVAGGLILVAALAYTLIKHSPPPWRNAIFGVLALGMFAFGTGSKFDLSMNAAGIKLQVTELEKTVEDQKLQIAALHGTLTQFATAFQVADDGGRFKNAMDLGSSAATAGKPVTLDLEKMKSVLSTLKRDEWKDWIASGPENPYQGKVQ